MKKVLAGLLGLFSFSVFAQGDGFLNCKLDIYKRGKAIERYHFSEPVEKLSETTFQKRSYITSEDGRFSFEFIAQINLNNLLENKSITVAMRDKKSDLAHDTESINKLSDGVVESRFKQFDKDGGYNYGTDGYVGRCSLDFSLTP